MKKFLMFVIVVLLTGCGTVQTYKGPALKSSEIAKIEGFKFSRIGLPSRYEYLLLIKSKDLVVGSYMGGYPDYIEVLPGKNEITVEYKNNLGKSLLNQATLVNSGVIGGAIANATENKNFIKLNFTAEAGHSYKIMMHPNLLSEKNEFPQPWIVDMDTKEVVYGQLPEGITDPLVIE